MLAFRVEEPGFLAGVPDLRAGVVAEDAEGLWVGVVEGALKSSRMPAGARVRSFFAADLCSAL